MIKVNVGILQITWIKAKRIQLLWMILVFNIAIVYCRKLFKLFRIPCQAYHFCPSKKFNFYMTNNEF